MKIREKIQMMVEAMLQKFFNRGNEGNDESWRYGRVKSVTKVGRNVIQIVVTGGPCAGKTTALTKVEQILTKRGYKVIVVAETATELIVSGISPAEFETEFFQDLLISRAINKEETALKAAENLAERLGKKVVIFYDRGLMDNLAYMPMSMLEKILAKYNMTIATARERYDAVLHLVTAAIGAESKYTTKNNKARTEGLKEARALDLKTKLAWVGAPHLRIIDNSTDFEKKMDRFFQEVYTVLGIPVPIETELKFLVEKPAMELLEGVEGVTKLQITQTYLKSDDPSIERRVRQRGEEGSYVYIYTEKKQISDISREETERRISRREYVTLLKEGVKSIQKTRYCFIYQNQYFELDVYPDWNDEAILEIELTTENQKVTIPDWIEVLEDVTTNPDYKNCNLAK